MQSTLINIDLLKENPDNPRTITDPKFQALIKSVKEFPKMLEVRPIAFKTGYVVLGGNMRLRACKAAGIKEVPAIDCSEMTEEQQREFIIKDNIGFGEWNWEQIVTDWPEAVEWGLDIPDKFQVHMEASEDDYEIPDVIETDIVLGDLFEIGEHRLLCGDSTDSDAVAKLMNGSKADMVFTSPPYNGNTDADRGGKKNMKGLYLDNETDNKSSSEYLEFNEAIFNSIYLILNELGVILYNINYNKNSPSEYIDIIHSAKDKYDLVETIIWEKQLAVSLQGNNLTRIYEFIFVLFNGEGKPKLNKGQTECEKNLWKISNIGANNEHHSACFPVALVDKAINLYAKDGALLFEPFTGSGTTMVAAHQLNRKCYGMELDPKYCQVIIDRMLKLDPSLTILKNGLPL